MSSVDRLRDVLTAVSLLFRGRNDLILEHAYAGVELQAASAIARRVVSIDGLQRLDAVDQGSDVADQLGDKASRVVFELPMVRAALPVYWSSSAAKHSSSSGTTPQARRRVASFCARASLSAVLLALAISAL